MPFCNIHVNTCVKKQTTYITQPFHFLIFSCLKHLESKTFQGKIGHTLLIKEKRRTFDSQTNGKKLVNTYLMESS